MTHFCLGDQNTDRSVPGVLWLKGAFSACLWESCGPAGFQRKPPCFTGLLKRSTHGAFSTPKCRKPPFTSCNAQVYNARIPVLGAPEKLKKREREKRKASHSPQLVLCVVGRRTQDLERFPVEHFFGGPSKEVPKEPPPPPPPFCWVHSFGSLP